jgi:hypothetical protein
MKPDIRLPWFGGEMHFTIFSMSDANFVFLLTCRLMGDLIIAAWPVSATVANKRRDPYSTPIVLRNAS